ncbi:hypothetical protein ABOM_002797 [Aspergillus bombycis]|uniref:Uncharacterized protein n=1 Tax=Aspergillus bombycis TaxID=109264 RepID=A0A1F8A9B2_9EURO|nr:hypothetical protein ABOM_002797 [Aspergillus bombycis]OGM47945.1 hypothetical protein ABOM_002797 [Aspergillus bombycis]
MVTRGLWNLHVDGMDFPSLTNTANTVVGKWYRWFHPPRGQSSSPDSPTTLKTLNQILSKTDKFKWESVPFPTPLHFQLDYVYTIDEDAGHFTVTQWKTVNQVLHRITRKATLASIRETSHSTVDTLLNDVGGLSKHNDPSLSDIRDKTNVQHLLKSFGIKPSIPTRLNELQFQLFTDFVFTWRFYFDDTSTWEHSSSLFSALAIGILRIAAWDLEVRNMDTEELPITFSSLPRWKAPINEIFWFHKYLIVCCHTDQIGTFVATKAQVFARSTNHKGPVHGIAISIRHVVLFEIFNGNVLYSTPIPLVTNTSALCCSPGFRIMAYIFTSNRWKGVAVNPREYWGVTIPTELFENILATTMPRDLVSMAQASDLVEKWYYSSIPQIHDLKLQSFALSIPCCGKRNTSDATGVYCSVCYAWSHLECTDLSSVPFATDKLKCSDCQESRPCTSLDTGGIHQFYRAKRGRKACNVIHGGKTTNLRLRVSKPSSRRPELWLIRTHGPPPPQSVDYTIFFSETFSGLVYGFDE